MVNFKGKEKITYLLFYLSCFAFALGKVVFILDYLVTLFVIWQILINKKLLFEFIYKFRFILVILICSYILNIEKVNLLGTLYLLRLILYLFLGYSLFVLEKPGIFIRTTYLFIFISCVLGIMQYIFIPDLRFLKYLGWDDHLYRLVGMFLDPSFMAVILGIGGLMALSQKHLWHAIIFFISIALTFSRAGILSLLIALPFLLKIKTKLILIIILFFGFLFVSPKPEGEGVNYLRTASIKARLNSYTESLQFINKSPVYGIGFNNICEYKKDKKDHSCSGFENSFLVILTTLGVCGVFVLMNQNVKELFKDRLVGAVIVLVLTNSFFNNTLFYSPIMFLLAVVISSSKQLSPSR